MTNQVSNNVSVIDSVTNTVTVNVGNGPYEFGQFIGPNATTSVPTLSEWGLLALMGLLGLFAAFRLRQTDCTTLNKPA